MLVHTTFKGQQVMRYFFVSVDLSLGYKARYFSEEVVQRWIAPNGKHATLALSRSMGFYFDLWIFGGTMEIRSNLSIYDRLPYCTYPKRRYIPELKRGGFNGQFNKVYPHDYFVNLLADSRNETMLKAGYANLFRYFVNNSKKLDDYWPSIRIAIRNGFKIKDAGIWIDYLDQLRYFGKDLHNPHFVCPADFRAEHDRYSKKRQRIREIEWARQAEERERRAREWEEEKQQQELETENRFRKLAEQFGDFAFTDGTISMRVLQSAEELHIEGKAMHHCVGGYYDRADSLILSATIDGERLATIEFSISKLMVLQCRGVCNSEVENQSQILDLVNSNIPVIKQRLAA
jgi:hypothetical protein